MPDLKKIDASLLKKTFIEKIYFFNEIDSTNTYAKSLIDENNVLILTNYQKKGRGRFERNWASEKDSNLTFTIRKHFNIDSLNIQSINYFSAYCVFEGLRNIILKNSSSGLINLTIKWPNDILLDGRKLCGLLIENNLQKNDFIIGIGVNVNQDIFSEELQDKTISLINYFGHQIDISEILIEIVNCLDKNLYLINEHKYSRIIELWKKNNDFIGKNVLFTTIGNTERNAQIIDFMNDGGIKLKIKGREIIYYSGDIKILKILNP